MCLGKPREQFLPKFLCSGHSRPKKWKQFFQVQKLVRQRNTLRSDSGTELGGMSLVGSRSQHTSTKGDSWRPGVCWDLDNSLQVSFRFMTQAQVKTEKGLHQTNGKNDFLTVKNLSERPFQRNFWVTLSFQVMFLNILRRQVLRKVKDPQFSCPNSFTFSMQKLVIAMMCHFLENLVVGPCKIRIYLLWQQWYK